MKGREITIRPLNDNDVALLTAWLSKDYVLRWYNDPSEWLLEVNGRNDAYAWIRHFIVMDAYTPIGFCQYYDCYDAKGMEDWYNVTQPRDTFSIDYLIGDEAYLGKGYGKAIVRLLTDTIQQKEHARQIIVQPEAENHPSNHVLIANGYIFDEDKKYYFKLLK